MEELVKFALIFLSIICILMAGISVIVCYHEASYYTKRHSGAPKRGNRAFRNTLGALLFKKMSYRETLEAVRAKVIDCPRNHAPGQSCPICNPTPDDEITNHEIVEQEEKEPIDYRKHE
jgi:hypothetical protein